MLTSNDTHESATDADARAAEAAFEAGQAANLEAFREQAKKLRAGCDGCHAQYMHVEQPPTP